MGLIGTRLLGRVALLVIVVVIGWTSSLAWSQAAQPATQVNVNRSRVTGLASMVTPVNGNTIPVAPRGGAAAVLPEDFLDQYGHLFGIVDRPNQLTVARAQVDALGFSSTTYQQFHRGVPVFSGIVKVHQNAAGGVAAANGDFYPIPDKLGVIPTLTEADAASLAADRLEDGNPWTERSELVVVDPGWYGDASIGARLAYHVVLNDPSWPLREAFFVDAHSGAILDQWSMIHHARNRQIYDGMQLSALPGVLARSEGQGAVVSPVDVNRAYDYYGDTYDYYFRAFGRDSIDDNGIALIATVNSQFAFPPCPNAFWNGVQMAFCLNTVTDDVVAHELTHGVTEYTSGLVYQNQSGQLNEALSDIFGELIDLFNGNAGFAGAPGGTPWPTHPTGPGLDTPNNLRTNSCSNSPGHADGVRWMLGEDAVAFGGAIRDMWNPPCYNDPDFNNSPLQTCPANDNGGVHSGSGIANHAFAIMTDGKVFNGFNVTGIGPIKAGAVWYRAQTTYFTAATDYADAYNALTLAANDLIGTTPNDPRTGLASASIFTAGDANEVDKALLAVEMNTDGSCGFTMDVLNPNPPTLCDPRTTLYFDDFESGANGWTVTNSNPPTPYDWVQAVSLPFARPGTAWFCDDPSIGDCAGNDESGTHTLFSPMIALPPVSNTPTIIFTHYLATEGGYDGGNVSVSVNGGAWQLVTLTSFDYNAYNQTLVGAPQNTNPMAGQDAWSGAGGQWGTSVIDLSGIATGGQTIQVRFDFGKDGCTGVDGWYVDDFEVFSCPCVSGAPCDDGLFCNGTETCVAGLCQSSGNPCGQSYCDECTDSCVAGVALREKFECGVNGWTLHGAGSTATAGDWVIGDPIGTTGGNPPQQAQPETAFEGANCAFTGQNPGAQAGTDDVDGGVTYLVSPQINLSGALSAQLTFVRWFYNRDLGEDANDFFVVEVSNNNGASWVPLETLGTNVNANSWTPRSFALQSFISLNANVRVRFGTSDGPGNQQLGNLIEGAVDDILITRVDGCVTNGDCNDGNPCTNDVCTAGSCSNANNSASCNDGNACTTNDACSGGACVGGPAPNCNDGNPCTNDSCSPASGCMNVNNSNPCSDGNACTTNDACSGGACVGGPAPNCNDNNACTNDSCNPASGCVNSNNNNSCDDGLFCTLGDACSGGACAGGAMSPCGNAALCNEATNQCGCEQPAAAPAASRHLAVTPGPSTLPVALLVVGDAGDNDVSCVSLYVQANGTLGPTPVFRLPSEWTTVYVGDSEIHPSTTYSVRTDCGTGGAANLSTAASVTTRNYGDFTGVSVVNIDDMLIILNAFSGTYVPGTTEDYYDVVPCVPNGAVDIDDILAVLGAFGGELLDCAAPCP